MIKGGRVLAFCVWSRWERRLDKAKLPSLKLIVIPVSYSKSVQMEHDMFLGRNATVLLLFRASVDRGVYVSKVICVGGDFFSPSLSIFFLSCYKKLLDYDLLERGSSLFF